MPWGMLGLKKVYIGYDELEKEAYEVTKSSLLRYSPDAIVTPLEISKLHSMGLLRRPVDRRGDNHSYDLWSNAPAATDFAISRFLVPHLAQTGWALFVDCDMVFMSDIQELFDIADDRYAVMVVKHGSLRGGYRVSFDERCELVSEESNEVHFYVHPAEGGNVDRLDWEYLKDCCLSGGIRSLESLGWSIDQSNWRLPLIRSKEKGDLFIVSPVAEDCTDKSSSEKYIRKLIIAMTKKKMGSQAQQPYKRKNWSSVMLFNCDHPANQRLSLQDINERPGRDLHAFYWLNDSEIGELPGEYNWLVNVQPKPENPKIAHFTTGGPWIDGWEGAEHDDLWICARDG